MFAGWMLHQGTRPSQKIKLKKNISFFLFLSKVFPKSQSQLKTPSPPLSLFPFLFPSKTFPFSFSTKV